MNQDEIALEIARREQTDGEDWVVAMKKEFRRQDQALAREIGGYEVFKRNVALLGMDPDGERPRLLSINGIRFRK